MKNLLLFAYFYPPLGGPGIQRPVKLVKYLKRYNWQTDVISVRDIVFHSSDNDLLEENQAESVIRTASLDLMSLLKKLNRKKNNDKIYFKTPEKYKKFIRNVFPIDDKIGWLRYAVKAGRSLLLTKKYDAVMATIGPYTAGIAAYKLCRRYNKSLVIDYRDHWTLNPYIKFPTKIHKKLSEGWESKLLDFSTVTTTISQTMKEEIVAKFGNHLDSKIHVMYNGWDENDFQNVKKSKKTRKIVFRYIGNFYGHRTPKYFITALESLIRKNKMPNDVLIEFIGNYYIETINILQNSKALKLINIVPQVSHNQAIKYMVNSDALLLFIASPRGRGVLTGKLFEYLRSGKEILAMTPPEGEASAILRNLKHNYVSSMEDVDAIANNFLKIYKNIKSNKIKERRVPSQYTRENQTKEFLTFLEQRLDII